MTPRPVEARFNVLGVEVSAIDIPTAVARIDGWIADRQQRYVTVTGAHGVIESRTDPVLRAIHNRAGMVTPDGMPLVWLGHLHGHGRTRRVYGPDLMLAVLERSLTEGHRHYFYGGAPGVAEQLIARLRLRFPGLQVAGSFSPPFRPMSEEEDAGVVAAINAAEASIVWVGLSTPKQERWMAAHLGRLTAPVMIGVGAAFDFHAGLKPQAPRWMQRSGLEWAFRALTEPRRLGRRYAAVVPRFLLLSAAQLLRLRSFPAA